MSSSYMGSFSECKLIILSWYVFQPCITNMDKGLAMVMVYYCLITYLLLT